MSFTTTQIWSVIVGLGLGSYLLRLSFLGIIGNRDLPEWLLRHLRHTAVAIMPGMITPLILFPQAAGGTLDPVRMIAALATVAISFWTKSAVLTIFGGAAVLFALHFGIG
ncbi:AzlD domain-containing protein [Roseinatronobacter sp. NSM]|uniref:AzlD domain-containing protein n=1 Tax=Roseinatronobacter sp. NSM TaxID=3457785 RepID=UPI0040364B2C